MTEVEKNFCLSMYWSVALLEMLFLNCQECQEMALAESTILKCCLEFSRLLCSRSPIYCFVIGNASIVTRHCPQGLKSGYMRSQGLYQISDRRG